MFLSLKSIFLKKSQNLNLGTLGPTIVCALNYNDPLLPTKWHFYFQDGQERIIIRIY